MLKNNGFHNRHTPILRAFSPLSLFSGGAPGAWYDPSDFSTLFQDSAGTTPVTAVDQPVGRMLDKSGYSNNALQTTSASRPLLKIDENGKYYLLFDGVDDGLSTGNINFTATNKMSIFVGTRKLSDAAISSMYELSANFGANTGTFCMFAPNPAAGNYGFRSRGTATAAVNVVTGVNAPVTNVLTTFADIVGTSMTIRNNGVLVENATSANQGTGNYGNHPLYIGRRGGTNLPFNGRIYSLIIVGKTVTTDETTSTETYVNQKTGAY